MNRRLQAPAATSTGDRVGARLDLDAWGGGRQTLLDRAGKRSPVLRPNLQPGHYTSWATLALNVSFILTKNGSRYKKRSEMACSCRPQQRAQRLWCEKVKTSSVRQDISRILLNPKVHRRVHNSQPLIRTLNQTYPVSNFRLFSVRSVSSLSSHLRLGLPSGRFFRVSPPKPCKAFTFSSMCATYLAYPSPSPSHYHVN